MSWDNDYTTAVNYPDFGYNLALSPVFQSFCLLNQGCIAGLPGDGSNGANKSGNYLELGFGQGVSLNIHAAASEASFWGTDFNPSHVCFAQTMADISKADVHLLDASFEELAARSDLPQFDAIVLYGVWSWVSHESRSAILKLLRRNLKPGGVVFVSYNVTAGWSAAIPVRHLLALHAQEMGQGENLQGRIDAALAFTQQCAATRQGYFANNPDVSKLLKQLSGLSHDYLAHDFFNANWHPMPFAEVAARMNEVKLTFSCSANPLDHLFDLNVNQQTSQFLLSIDSVSLRESLWDCLVSQTFRKDIFVRGGRLLTSFELLQEKRQRRFVLLKHPGKIPMETRKSRLKAELAPSVYEPILAALAEDGWSAKSIGWLESRLLPIEITVDILWQAITVLIGEEHVIPVHTQPESPAVRMRCHALNTFLLQRARSSNDTSVLASPVSGGGIAVSRSEKLFLLARREGARTSAQLVEFAWKHLEASTSADVLLRQENAPPAPSREERMATLDNKVAVFLESRLAVLAALGID